MERSYGSFSHSLTLPIAVDPDQANATCKNGVLSISLPKPSEVQAKAKKIAAHLMEADESDIVIDNGALIPDFDPKLLNTLRDIDLSQPIPDLWAPFEAMRSVPLLAMPPP